MSAIQRTCDVCLEPYSMKRIPKVVIPCGHTFCEICLARLVSDQQSCPVDRGEIISSVINFALLDPGQAIAKGQEAMVAQVKARIPEDERKSPEPQVEPTIAICELGEQAELTFEECAHHIQVLVDQSENECPIKSSSNDFEEEAACIHRAIANRETPLQVYMRALYLQAVLFWSRGWGYSPQEQVREWFSAVKDSVRATPKDVAHARFAYAYLELNRTDFSVPEYARIKRQFEQVVDDPNTKEVHRLAARFYLACFCLKGLGGVEKSIEEAQRQFLSVVNKQALPDELNNFTKLILAEFHIQNERFSDAAGLLLSIRSNERRVLAKAAYWMGCLHDQKKLLYASKEQAKQYLRQGLSRLVKSEHGSFSELKKRLEKTFKLGDRHLAGNSYDDDERGPHFESYLDLHLDQSGWSCVIQ